MRIASDLNTIRLPFPDRWALLIFTLMPEYFTLSNARRFYSSMWKVPSWKVNHYPFNETISRFFWIYWNNRSLMFNRHFDQSRNIQFSPCGSCLLSRFTLPKKPLQKDFLKCLILYYFRKFFQTLRVLPTVELLLISGLVFALSCLLFFFPLVPYMTGSVNSFKWGDNCSSKFF